MSLIYLVVITHVVGATHVDFPGTAVRRNNKVSRYLMESDETLTLFFSQMRFVGDGTVSILFS